MGRSSSAYERELKDLLRGDTAAIERYGRLLPARDRAILRSVVRMPFLVVRAAGSFGFDLVALRGDFSFPLEVKASASDTIRFSASSGRAAEQLEEHRRAVDRVGLVVLYAYRRIGHRNGDPWRLYAAGSPSTGGRASLLKRRLPAIATTRGGNGVLRWDDGMPLVRFLDFIVDLMAPRPAGLA